MSQVQAYLSYVTQAKRIAVGLPLLGMASVLAWSSPAWSLLPMVPSEAHTSIQSSDRGRVLVAEPGGRGAGQGPPSGTVPGSGRGATGGTGKGSPGAIGPGSGTGSTGATEGTGNPGGSGDPGSAGSTKGGGGTDSGGGMSSGGAGGASSSGGASGGSGAGGGR